MVFMGFVVKGTGFQERMYFVGDSFESILLDTKNGTEFGGVELLPACTPSEEEVRELNLSYFEDGVAAVKNEGCKSYKLGPPLAKTCP